MGKSIYSQELLSIIDHCLQLDYLERPQSVFSLQKTLVNHHPAKPTKKVSFAKKIQAVLSKPL